MGIRTVAFFSNKGGVGQTSLVYHLAWMYADMGVRVMAADLDPQANLTAAFLDEDTLEQVWATTQQPGTIFSAVEPLVRGTGDVILPCPRPVAPLLDLLVGDLRLSGFEDELSNQWPRCNDGQERAFRVISAFWRVLEQSAAVQGAELVLIDVGHNLGAINRAALIAADHVVVPLAPDLFSLQGLRNLGPALRTWRWQWAERRAKNPDPSLALPSGGMRPLGYVILQHAVRLDRPVRAYAHWLDRIPGAYRNDVLGEPTDSPPAVADDPLCLDLVKHYRSLIPMAQEARKPIFHLQAADGALGAHGEAVRQAHDAFRHLADQVRAALDAAVPA